MLECLLCERDVLNKMGWPSREFINTRIRTDRFPRPAVRYRGIGDQWRESDVDAWIMGKPKLAPNLMLERFAL